MSMAEFVGITEKFDNAELEHVIIEGRHTCLSAVGQPLTAWFTLNAGNEGTPHLCGCFLVVPAAVWDEWTSRYRFARRLEGK